MYLPNIRALRLARHMTQKQVAEQLGICISAYKNLEKGAVNRVKQLCALADFYQVSMEYLLGRTNDPTPHA